MLRLKTAPGEPSYEPSVENTNNKSYPLARSLLLYTLGEPEGAVKTYIEWILSPAGQKIVEDAGIRAPGDKRASGGPRARVRRRRGLTAAGRARLDSPATDAPTMTNDPRARLPQNQAATLGGDRGEAARGPDPPERFSAIIFVLSIFFFIFREAAPVLVSESFHLGQFLFSTEWYPTSVLNVRYGTLALTVGTASVTVLAMLLAVPFGLGGAIYISEFCGPPGAGDAQGRDRAAVGHPERRLGLHRSHGHEQAARPVHRGAGRSERPERRHHPRAHERAHHRLDRRGRAQGRSRLLP